MTNQSIQQDAICYQWFKQRLILSVSEPSINQQSQIKEDTVEPSVLARDINESLETVFSLSWSWGWMNLGACCLAPVPRSNFSCSSISSAAHRDFWLLRLINTLTYLLSTVGEVLRTVRKVYSYSSRMRIMNHNWSAMKRHLHPQSVAEISRRSVLWGDRIRQCGTSSGSRHKDTDQCL